MFYFCAKMDRFWLGLIFKLEICFLGPIKFSEPIKIFKGVSPLYTMIFRMYQNGRYTISQFNTIIILNQEYLIKMHVEKSKGKT